MAITFESKTKTFFLDGKNSTYAFFINCVGYAEHLYYGSKISHDDLTYTRAIGTYFAPATVPGTDGLEDGFLSYMEFPSELGFYGTGDYREPAVLVQNKNGDRLCELLYDSYEIVKEKPKMQGMPCMDGGETLILRLKDKINGFAADLYYTVYDDCDVIARRVVYKNLSNEDKTLRRAYSFTFALPNSDYDIITLHGGWARENHIERINMHHGSVSVDSKRVTSSSTLNPFMAVAEHGANETSGRVWGLSLIYSSSYVLKAETAMDGTTAVLGGINDFDFSWRLNAGEEFETPEVAIAYSDEGIGGMSRNFHDAYRNHLINKRFVNKHRPLVINNWEATYMDFDNEKLMAISDAVKGTGIDTFVLDDGWFGARSNDFAGLGDWVVNTEKLKGGFKALTEHLHKNGMKFGLWFEPECVNIDSDLFRSHPDWAVSAPDRKNSLSRHQLILDITRKEVRDYIVESVNKVLDENDIEYVKWDYNRNITELYSVGREPERQSEFAHRYALGLYDLFERIINANPDVFFEGCSGGGGRFDPAVLAYFPQVWTSDDTDAEERTSIQYGTSLVYPLSAMSCHVSVCPNHQTGRTTPFATRADIASLGATGYELDTTRFTAEEKEEVKKQTEEYRACQDIILFGDLYRIDNPMESDFFSETIVSKDKNNAVLITYRRLGRANNEAKRICPAGLDPDKKYCVRELDREISGDTLMNVGIAVKYPSGDFMSVKYHLKAL